MSNMEKYKELRIALFDLINNKIIKYMLEELNGRKIAEYAAQKLNLLDRKRKIIIEDQSDMDNIMDFSMYEYKIDGKNVIQLYKENVGSKDEMEEIILNSLEKSILSLFRIVNVSHEKNMIFLKDVFNREKNIRLTDIDLSLALDEKFLLFTRVLPMGDINMTSGIGYAFDAELEPMFITELDLMKKNTKPCSENELMFKYFFPANKIVGFDYQNIIDLISNRICN